MSVIRARLRKSRAHPVGLWRCPGCDSGWRTPDPVSHPVTLTRPTGKRAPALVCYLCRDRHTPRHPRPAKGQDDT